MADDKPTAADMLGAIDYKLSRPVLPQQFMPEDAYPQVFVDQTHVFGTSWITVGDPQIAGVGNGSIQPHARDSAGNFHTLIVQPQKRAAIKRFAAVTDSIVGNMFIRFRFLLNGATHWNYQAPPTLFGTISNPVETWVVLDQSQNLDLQLFNLDPTVAYDVFTTLVVWTWDPEPIRRAGRR